MKNMLTLNEYRAKQEELLKQAEIAKRFEKKYGIGCKESERVWKGYFKLMFS